MQHVQENETVNMQYEQVYLVYKFLESPLEILKATINQQDDTKKYYKKIAKQLHPDKNSHPSAKEAF